MTKEADMKLAAHLQPLAGALSDTLNEIAGMRVTFILAVQVDKTLQYVANGERADCMEVLEDLLKRWKEGRADINALYNPDLDPNRP